MRFAADGVGVPLPVEPTSRQLTVGGPYRYVRNPRYLARVLVITGQALPLNFSASFCCCIDRTRTLVTVAAVPTVVMGGGR